MPPRGRLRWVGARPAWPRGPVQWVLTVIGAVVTLGYLLVQLRLDPIEHFFESTTINLLWFATLLVLSLLYRIAGGRHTA